MVVLKFMIVLSMKSCSCLITGKFVWPSISFCCCFVILKVQGYLDFVSFESRRRWHCELLICPSKHFAFSTCLQKIPLPSVYVVPAGRFGGNSQCYNWKYKVSLNTFRNCGWIQKLTPRIIETYFIDPEKWFRSSAGVLPKSSLLTKMRYVPC